MQIVIDIPDRIAYGVQNGITKNGSIASKIVLEAVKNGKPLPKGHGALKDADKLSVAIAMIRDKWNYYGNEYESAKFRAYDNSIDEIADAPTIIEADKEGEEPWEG